MDFIYKIIKDENGEIEECYLCTCAVALLEFDNPDLYKRSLQPKVLLCELCSSTTLGFSIIRDNGITPLALAQSINLILSKLNQ